MTQPHYIDRKAQPVSNPYRFAAEIAWLQEAARYFSNRPTGGEDAAHWSNVYNAENANKIASRLDALSSRPAPMEAVPARCQKCGGEIQGWTCQGCGQVFRENDAGALVFAPMEAVAWRYRYPNDPTWQLTLDRKQAHDKTGEVQALAVIPTQGGGPAPFSPGEMGE
jgi:hypothetical protein